MFSLIFYCGLILSVVSAHFNNDTLHDGDELDINTTLSTLASTTIPVSKDCVLEMKENEISQIVELFNNNLVNVVVIHISFSNGSHEGQLFSDFNVSLSNPIGREILYALEREEFRYFPWTLKAGIRNFKLNVKGSQNDCTKTGKNATDFVLESTQHIVDSINLATNYQVCSFFKETSSGKVKKTCCEMTKPNLATKFNYKCPKENSFLFGSDLLWRVMFWIMLFFALFYLMWLLLVCVSRTEFDLKYPEYYKLEESLISPSSILLKVFWDENGRVVFFIRSLVLVGVFSCLWYWYIKVQTYTSYLNIIVVFWGLSFLVSNLFRSRSAKSSIILHRIKLGRYIVRMPQFFLNNPDTIWEKDKQGDFEILVKIIILPFNSNVWRNVKEVLYQICTGFARWATGRFRNRILKTLVLCVYYVVAVLICFVFTCILFCFLILLSITCFFMSLGMFLVLIFFVDSRDDSWFSYVLSVFHAIGFNYSIIISVTVVASSIMSFLLGLFLNLIYFIPYLAFFSVLTFYCCTYWKTMEEKYFVLKRLIYEACQETQNINNRCILNGHPEPNEEVLPVVSKELYDKIREELLPYDTNLFSLGLKMFWSIAFSLGIFVLINMLNEFSVTGVIQVVTTASLGVMPHIFNMVGLKTSEERKKAENEKLKLNVKYMVEKLIREDSKLAQAVLITEQNDDKRPYNISFVPCLEKLLDCVVRCNSGAENDEWMTRILIAQANDENVQNSEKLLTRPESNPGNEDIEVIGLSSIVTVHRNARNEIVEDFEHVRSDLSAGNGELAQAVMTQEKSNTTIDKSIQHFERDQAIFGSNNGVEDVGPTQTEAMQEYNSTISEKNIEDSERIEARFGSCIPDNDHTEDVRPTQIVVIQENNGTTSAKNIEDSEHIEARFGSNVPDNDHTEDVRPTQIVVLQENNGTISAKNIQDSEHIEASFGSNVPDNDHTEDVRPTQIVVLQENNCTTSAKNIQDSEHIEARFGSNVPDNDNTEDVRPTQTVLVIQENNGTTSEKNIQDCERIQSRFVSNVHGKDNIEGDELAPSLPAQENSETTSDENIRNSGNAPARSDLNSTSLAPMSALVFVKMN